MQMRRCMEWVVDTGAGGRGRLGGVPVSWAYIVVWIRTGALLCVKWVFFVDSVEDLNSNSFVVC
jgi:hypothetical protein